MSALQKKCCEFNSESEDRVTMNETMRSRLGAFIAPLLGLVFVWTLVLSVSPQLHERIHRDANRVEHSCAVTFVASGSYEHTAPPLVIPAPLASRSALVVDLNPSWVRSAFLSASIFEHAPPAHG
jgi:hypothetical protein